MRDSFDVVLDELGDMSSYLASDANIVAFPDFEHGLAKILSGAETSLTSNERKLFVRLASTHSPRAHHSSAQTDLSKRKRTCHELDEVFTRKA